MIFANQVVLDERQLRYIRPEDIDKDSVLMRITDFLDTSWRCHGVTSLHSQAAGFRHDGDISLGHDIDARLAVDLANQFTALGNEQRARVKTVDQCFSERQAN